MAVPKEVMCGPVGCGIRIVGQLTDEQAEIVSEPALALIANLHRRFDGRRRQLLVARRERQAR